MKIKTKYDIDDTIIYETDKGLKLAKVCSFEITYTKLGGIFIEYELEAYIGNHLIKLNLSEGSITCKATKRLINKHLIKE